MGKTYHKTAEGVAKLADADALKKDSHGFTNPNLHRRIEKYESPSPYPTKEYKLGVYDKLHSTRLTKINFHDEDSNTSEIP